MDQICSYYNLSDDKLNLVGEQPWSMKEPMFMSFKISESIPEISEFNINIPIDSPIFVEELAKAEIEAMKILLYRKHYKIVPAVMALINKIDYREIHNHLLVIFCFEKYRRQLLSNWKLKRFIVDYNYICTHLGVSTLRYCDRKVHVSKEAIAIVKNLGCSTPAQVTQYICPNKTIEEKLRKLSITVKNPQTKPRVLKRSRIAISRICEQSKKSKDEKNHVAVYRGDYTLPNPTQIVSLNEVKKAQDKIKFFEPELKNVVIEEDIKAECIKSINKIIEYRAKKSYKEMLLKECEEKIKCLGGSLYGIRERIRDIDVTDQFKDILMKENFGDFEEEFSEQSLGYDMFSDLEKPWEIFRDFVNSEKLREESNKNKEEDFKKVRERNYKRYKISVREEWADVFFGIKMTALKLLELKGKLLNLRIKEPKVLNYNWDIVRSNYFKNEAIKRSIKDLEYKRRNFNYFKLDRTRKQRARSIIDDYFGTSSVCCKKRKMYGCREPDSDKKTLFIMRGIQQIMMSTMNSNYMGVQKTRIQEYFEDIPFRQFTRKGIEIRDLEFISNVSCLCKRKAEKFVNEVSKRRDVKFGEMDIDKENELLDFFLKKIEGKKSKIFDCYSKIESLSSEVFTLKNEISREKNKSRVPVKTDKKTEEERIFEMFGNHKAAEISKTHKEKELKKEKRLQEEDKAKVLVKDDIDINNSNLEMVFNLRRSIITSKKDFDNIVNSEIESIGLEPQELHLYRRSRLEEEVSKMERYNEFIKYLRSTDQNNIYTKDLIIMKFLRYQTLNRNVNIDLECSMEERMFKICLDRFESGSIDRKNSSELRYKTRVNEAVDKGIIVRREEWDLNNKAKQVGLLKEFKKKIKIESKKADVQEFMKPNLSLIEEKKALVENKQSLIESLYCKIEEVKKNIELFTLQKGNIMKKGYNKEVINCKKKMISKSVNVSAFRMKLREQLTRAEIVEVEDDSRVGENEFIKENIKYAFKLMTRRTLELNEAYRNMDRRRYEIEIDEYLNGNKQIVKI